MKICIVFPSDKFLSGIGYYGIRLSNALTKCSDISVIQLRNMLPKILFPGKDRVGKHITDLKLSDKIKVFNGMDYNNPLTWLNAYNFLKEEKPDVIILQWWTSSVSHMLLILKLFASCLNIKVVMEFHEVVDPLEESILPIKLYSKFMGRIIKRNLSGYISHSESDKLLLAERYDIDKDKINVIPHGLYDHYKLMDKHTSRHILNIENEAYVILFLGLVRNYKGVRYLIEAFNKLPPDILPKSKLLIVGEIWEDKENLLKQISSNITFIDEYIPDEKINLYLSTSDIIVLPYIRASQSGIAHIAMSVGKPIIASNVGGLKESLGKYEGVFFVSPMNSEEIKNKLIENFGNNRLYKPPTELSWSDISKLYIDILTSSSKKIKEQ